MTPLVVLDYVTNGLPGVLIFIIQQTLGLG